MEERKFPVMEDDNGCMTAAEPAVAYAANSRVSTGIVYVDDEAEKIDHIPLGLFGFYSDAPEVFEQRVAGIEADMDEVDA